MFKAKTPQLKDVLVSAHRLGVASTTFKISREDANRIRESEKVGGQQTGRIILELMAPKIA